MSKIKTLDCQAAREFLTQDDVLVLDCRDVKDYQAGHIDGALHAHDGLVESLIKKGDKARKILIYCYSGHRSEHLTEFFTGFGFTETVNMAGGYSGWQALADNAIH
ncbi:MAG: sulfurtransferase [Oceanospirillaceae bacterium]|nr:sulfurtransferase [Oceanospirillaceae bacterium]MBT12051.1 sulfurtransferase [Oceanospirillaceae bacterium]|tara:strand:- start:63125 stop:63442 length:318 start_codon:yes stop_codon:yes gene_type:complete